MNLRDKTVLITGGSQGLGAALGFESARRGARVVLVARHDGALNETVSAIRAAGGIAHAVPGDVADKDAVYAIAGAAAAVAGPVDVLVHNASTLGPLPMPLLLDTACEEFEAVLRVNLIGPFRLSKAVVGPMVLRASGVVVHVSSDAAVVPYARWGAYGVSKAAQDHLNRIWAAELEGTGVRFLAVDPGEMDTKMHADAIPDADRTALAKPADVARRIVALIERDAPVSGSRVEASSMEVAS